MIEKPPTNQNEEPSKNPSEIINNIVPINENKEVKNNMENSNNKNEAIIKSRAYVLENIKSPELLGILEQELVKRREFDLSGLSTKEQFKLIKGRSLKIIPENDLLERLEKSKQEEKPLIIKFGIDPTGSEIHIGHAVPMVIVNRFQRMGHKVVFVIGDFTAKIGDPSGRSSERPTLTDEKIAENLGSYKEQIKPFFDLSEAEILHNGDWLNDIKLPDFIKILSKINVSDSLQREDFRSRLSSGQGLTQAELIYSVVMAIDSLHINNDVEVGGVDQLLNLQMCRKVMQVEGQKSECLVTTDLLPGITGDGQKMSKSLGNYVGLSHPAKEIYGRIMSIPDSLLEVYFKAVSEIDDEEWNILDTMIKDRNLNPMMLKKMLARYMVTVLHTKEASKDAEQDFTLRFSKKSYAELKDVTSYEQVDANLSVLDFLSSKKLFKSRADIRRFARGGGIKIVDVDSGVVIKIENPIESFSMITDMKDFILKIGKRVLSIKLK